MLNSISIIYFFILFSAVRTVPIMKTYCWPFRELQFRLLFFMHFKSVKNKLFSFAEYEILEAQFTNSDFFFLCSVRKQKKQQQQRGKKNPHRTLKGTVQIFHANFRFTLFGNLWNLRQTNGFVVFFFHLLFK